MHIKVKTPSRLHLGILDLNGNLGRTYGSIGIALDYPNFVIEAEESDALNIPKEIKPLIERFPTEKNIKIEIKEKIPKHVGLGSGTQLALAVGLCLVKIHNLDLTVKEIAKVMGRGTLSGIGIAAFEHGGFVVDGGKKVDSYEIPPIIFHHPFPEDWRFVVAIPEVERGFFDEKEKEAFQKIIPASQEISGRICRLVQMKMLPSLLEKDIEKFGESLTEVDKTVGFYFKDVQGGIYREKISKGLIEFMLNSGSYGAGQSSWGPAVYGLIEKDNAEEFTSNVRKFLEEKKIEGGVFSASANNDGASCVQERSETDEISK